jgi:hypothetical protein
MKHIARAILGFWLLYCGAAFAQTASLLHASVSVLGTGRDAHGYRQRSPARKSETHFRFAASAPTPLTYTTGTDTAFVWADYN